jgi:S-adenosyl methyltransferase
MSDPTDDGSGVGRTGGTSPRLQSPRLQSSPEIDTTVSHSARVWDYWLGGKENYPVDREVGDRIAASFPEIVEHARLDRAFLGRAVRYLAGEAGIRQFIDVGTGLPTADNTHEVAQRVAPDSRVVYVDNDPLVLTHARALLTSAPEGATDYIDMDIGDPERIVEAAGRTLDFGRPVAITMLGVLWHILDDAEAAAVIDRYLDAVPSGSYLAIAHPTIEATGERMAEAIRQWNRFGKPPGVHRTPRQIAAFFDGLELVEPGVVPASRWRPDDPPAGEPKEVDLYCAVGRKP